MHPRPVRAALTGLLALALLGACNSSSEPSATGPAPSAASPTSPATADAKAVVGELYALAAKGTSVIGLPRAQLSTYFAPGLVDLLVRDAEQAGGQVGALDVDPLFDAQDIDVKDLAVGTATGTTPAVEVPVTFTNLGKSTKVVHVLGVTAGAWRISDIRYADGRALTGILAG